MSPSLKPRKPSLNFSTPRAAVTAMSDAGARFTMQPRRDSLLPAFTYEVCAGGNRERCREILRDAKERPAAFWHAFVAEVANIAGGAA